MWKPIIGKETKILSIFLNRRSIHICTFLYSNLILRRFLHHVLFYVPSFSYTILLVPGFLTFFSCVELAFFFSFSLARVQPSFDWLLQILSPQVSGACPQWVPQGCLGCWREYWPQLSNLSETTTHARDFLAPRLLLNMQSTVESAWKGLAVWSLASLVVAMVRLLTAVTLQLSESQR